MRLHHIGVAVENCKKAAEIWCEVGGYSVEVANVVDEERQVRIWLLRRGWASKIDLTTLRMELIEPLSSASPVTPMLGRRISAYHCCYETGDLKGRIKAFENVGAKLLGKPSPAPAFANRNVAFLFLPTRELVELLEA